MVSLIFKRKECITNSTLFKNCMLNCKKIEKLAFEELSIDMNFANELYSILD